MDDPEFVDVHDLAPRDCNFTVPLPEEATERRRAGRFPVDRVQSDQGRILDLSRTGLRMHRRGRLSSNRPVRLWLSDGEATVQVEADVRWEQKVGFMKWAYGLEFRDVSEETSRTLARIAANCREQRKLLGKERGRLAG
jgi:hypothetical protein